MKKKNVKNKRYEILMIFLIILMLILIINLFNVQIIKRKEYQKNLEIINKTIVMGKTAPRGRILDRNGKVIVDNQSVKEVVYQKPKYVTLKEELEIAHQLEEILDIDDSKLSDYNLRNFWLKEHKEEGNKKITDEERKKYKERKLSYDDIYNLKLERITNEELETVSRKAAYIYYLMNKGYTYSEKTIKRDITDEEFSIVGTANIKGVDVKNTWERVYNYGDTLKNILGTISSSESGIPDNLKDYYLKKGYNLDDRVGISYLEYQYDDYLKGEKNEYKLNDGKLILLNQGKKGSDIYLTIDIDLQMEVERIMEEEMIEAKYEPNTKYYNKSFVIINNPNTGEILAMAGKKINEINGEYKIVDYTEGIINDSIVVGSIIKGASQIVGYNTHALEIGEVRYDECVKLKGTPKKCSWMSLGRLDDIKALKMSSNTYQFFTALKVAGFSYFYDMPFNPSEDVFKLYRDTFKEFGLGVKTGIDLPNESIGIVGKESKGGLLLDFVIGQYDTYTPIQLNQYMSAIASSKRVQPHLVNKVQNKKKIILENKPKILNDINTESIYLDRVREGFKAVMEYGGTGSGYIDLDYNPAGKTGTSESFVDSDSDGILDKATITNTFSAFAPYQNPQVVFTVISPNIYSVNSVSNYQSTVNKRISKRVSQKYFEFYN